jgi:2-aminoadipate transaminase
MPSDADKFTSPDRPLSRTFRLAVGVEDVHAAALPYCTPGAAISLHLGYPDPAAFPAAELAEATRAVLRQSPERALQYCEERGDPALRGVIASMYAGLPKAVTPDNVIITQGTTDALEILPQLLISPRDVVLMEAPTYLWAIRSFRFRQARMIGIPSDEGGVRIDLLRDRLTGLYRDGVSPKFVYIMPDFQNPSGHCMPLARRRELLAVAEEFNLLVVEDTPYLELRYEGERLPTLFELDEKGLVVLAGSFSKSVGPGIRLGWVVGPEEFIEKLVRMKQTGACTLLSRAVALYIDTPAYAENLERARSIYKRKCDHMAFCLGESCPDDVAWKKPQGGFYFWLRLPPSVNVQRLLARAASRNLLFLNGRDFFCDDTQWGALRLSFSYESEEKISAGISLLGELLHSDSSTR